jgi:hypothetical protein
MECYLPYKQGLNTSIESDVLCVLHGNNFHAFKSSRKLVGRNLLCEPELAKEGVHNSLHETAQQVFGQQLII